MTKTETQELRDENEKLRALLAAAWQREAKEREVVAEARLNAGTQIMSVTLTVGAGRVSATCSAAARLANWAGAPVQFEVNDVVVVVEPGMSPEDAMEQYDGKRAAYAKENGRVS